MTFIDVPLGFSPSTAAPDIVGRMFNAPIALDPRAAHLVFAPSGALGAALPARAAAERSSALYWTEAGVAVISVDGMLLGEDRAHGARLGLTGCDAVAAAYAAALADPAVRGIVLDIDSPGGDAHGVFDLAREIKAARSRKPSCAMVTGGAYSAAYALAAATGRIYVSESGGVGVLCLVADMSRMLKAQGITMNIVKFGDRKADGLEFVPLTPAARKRFQANVDQIGEIFVRLVADCRGTTPLAVRRSEAATYLGRAAVRAGFADMVASRTQAWTHFLGSLKTARTGGPRAARSRPGALARQFRAGARA